MNLTIMILIITTVFLAVFDVFIIAKKGKQESISAHIIRGSKKYPLLVLCFGVLLGHLFWSFRTEGHYENVKCYREINGESILLIP